MAEKRNLGISFGAMSPKFSEQLTAQGFNFSKETIGNLDKLKEHMLHLLFAGMLTDSQRTCIEKKLFSKIRANVLHKNRTQL